MDRKKEKEYGTYIIPGLKYTRTFLNAQGSEAGSMYIHDPAGPCGNG